MPMTLISRTTLTTTAASVTFNSIPQTYQTLKLVVSGRSNTASSGATIQLNTSTSNFTYRFLYGNGASATSSSGSTGAIADISVSTDTANVFGNLEITIPNYSGATNKAISVDAVTENNGTTAYQELWASLWSNTSAVSSVAIVAGGSFVSGSTFSLYGIA